MSNWLRYEGEFPKGFSQFGVSNYLFEHRLPSSFDEVTLEIGNFESGRLELLDKSTPSVRKYWVTKEQARFELKFFDWFSAPDSTMRWCMVIFPGEVNPEVLNPFALEDIPGNTLNGERLTVCYAEDIDTPLNAAAKIKADRFYFLSPDGDLMLFIREGDEYEGKQLGVVYPSKKPMGCVRSS